MNHVLKRFVGMFVSVTVFCSDGYEAHDVGTANPYCQICPVGTFKNNNAGYYGMCTPCPGNYRTPSEGSTSELQCTICK